MIKLIALYRKPDDLDAFLAHYRDTHTPLTKRLPGLQRLVVNRVTADAFGGEPEYVLIAELHFADREAYKRAMKSDENRELARDLRSFAGDRVTLLVVDSEEA